MYLYDAIYFCILLYFDYGDTKVIIDRPGPCKIYNN